MSRESLAIADFLKSSYNKNSFIASQVEKIMTKVSFCLLTLQDSWTRTTISSIGMGKR